MARRRPFSVNVNLGKSEEAKRKEALEEKARQLAADQDLDFEDVHRKLQSGQTTERIMLDKRNRDKSEAAGKKAASDEFLTEKLSSEVGPLQKDFPSATPAERKVLASDIADPSVASRARATTTRGTIKGRKESSLNRRLGEAEGRTGLELEAAEAGVEGFKPSRKGVRTRDVTESIRAAEEQQRKPVPGQAPPQEFDLQALTDAGLSATAAGKVLDKAGKGSVSGQEFVDLVAAPAPEKPPTAAEQRAQVSAFREQREREILNEISVKNAELVAQVTPQAQAQAAGIVGPEEDWILTSEGIAQKKTYPEALQEETKKQIVIIIEDRAQQELGKFYEELGTSGTLDAQLEAIIGKLELERDRGKRMDALEDELEAFLREMGSE